LKKVFFIFICVVFLNQFNIYAQNDEEVELEFIRKITGKSYGLNIGYSYNNHNPFLKSLPGLEDCCKLYEKGSGNGLFASIFYQRDLNKNFFYGLEAGFIDASGIITANEYKNIIIENEELNAKIRHEIQAKLNMVFFNVYASVLFWDNFYFNAGLSSGYLFVYDVHKFEIIEEPVDIGGYGGEGRIWNEYEGKLNSVNNFLFDLNVGLTTEFGLTKKGNNKILVGLRAFTSLNSIIVDRTWAINKYMLTLGYKFNINSNLSSPLTPLE